MDAQDDRPVEALPALTREDTTPDFSWRATRVLAILGGLSLLAGTLIAAAGDRSPGQLVTAAAAILGSIGALGLVGALHGSRVWAVAWAKVALFLIALVGVGHTVLAIPSGTLWIPLDALLAVWALLAGDRLPPARRRLQPVGLGLVALMALSEAAIPLGSAAAELTKPGPDPNAVIVVQNESPRAVVVIAGSLMATRTGSTFLAPCGGVARIQVPQSAYETDGRLMAFIAVDQTGALDAWAATQPDPSALYEGSYALSPFWSRGDLAGRLPLRLYVHHDFSVDSSAPAPTPCTPDPSAVPPSG